MPNQLRQAFLEQARAIGDKLCREAVNSGDEFEWEEDAIEVEGDRQRVVRAPVGPNLYSGAGGIALFLARLFRVTSEERYRAAAAGGIRHALSASYDAGPDACVGLYAGDCGVAYAASEVGDLLGDGGLKEEAVRLLHQLNVLDPEGQMLDVVFGIAGAIPALLAVNRKEPRSFILETAIEYGDRLLDAARRGEAGRSWNTIGDPAADAAGDPCGLSHGASGIGWALLELARATGDERFMECAEDAFLYERHRFDPARDNWPDLRSFVEPSNRFPVAWCHGAPGIGLARLRAYEVTGLEVYKVEADAALRTTAKMLALPNDKFNYSLCHGIAGNADLFIYAARVLGDPSYMALAELKGAQGIEQFGDSPLPCGTPGGEESPGLMQGVAGIGYFYLRLYDPAGVPPVTLVLPS